MEYTVRKSSILAEANDFDQFLESGVALGDPFASGGNDVAVIAGGHDGYAILDSVEVYSPRGTCQHYLAPLPQKMYGINLAYLNGILLACGGRSPNGMTGNYCWRYVPDKKRGSWVRDLTMSLRQPRWLTAGAKVGKDRFYLTGGWTSPGTSEYFDGDSKTWKEGPNLLEERMKHCMVPYKDSFILFGGTDNPRKRGRGRNKGLTVEMYNVTTNQRSSPRGLWVRRSK